MANGRHATGWPSSVNTANPSPDPRKIRQCFAAARRTMPLRGQRHDRPCRRFGAASVCGTHRSTTDSTAAIYFLRHAATLADSDLSTVLVIKSMVRSSIEMSDELSDFCNTALGRRDRRPCQGRVPKNTRETGRPIATCSRAACRLAATSAPARRRSTAHWADTAPCGRQSASVPAA